MAPGHFIVLLLLAPCISLTPDEIDTEIEKLKMINEVLQDSVTYLLKQRSLMQTRLDNLTLQQPNATEIDSLKHQVNKSQKEITQLLQWTKAAEKKLDHPNCTMNETLLNKRLQPMNDQIYILKNDVESLSQRENAVQQVVVKQSQSIGFLFTKIKELKDTITSITSGIAQTMSQIQNFAKQSEKKLDDVKDDLQGQINKQTNSTNAGFSFVLNIIGNIQKNITKLK